MNVRQSFEHDLDWECKAKGNPLYAIMSESIFWESGQDIAEENLSRFWERGQAIWDCHFESMRYDLGSGGGALDYGCGMGRLSNAAAHRGWSVSGVDISGTQIELARKWCPLKDKIDFQAIGRDGTIPFDSGCFDLVFSYAVLQHIRETSALRVAVAEICRVVRVGGMVKIQVRVPFASYELSRYLVYGAYNFQSFSVMAYLRRRRALLFPRIRLVKHSHWTGAGCFLSMRAWLKLLSDNGLIVNRVELSTRSNIVWLQGERVR